MTDIDRQRTHKTLRNRRTQKIVKHFAMLNGAEQQDCLWMLGMISKYPPPETVSVVERVVTAPPASPSVPDSHFVKPEPATSDNGEMLSLLKTFDDERDKFDGGQPQLFEDTPLHDDWRCRICGKGITETRMSNTGNKPSPERPCRKCKRLLEIHVYGPLRQRYPRIRRAADPDAKEAWELARDAGIQHVRRWSQNWPSPHITPEHAAACPVCTMEPTAHFVESLR